MSLFSLTTPIRTRSAAALHHRFLIGAGVAGALAVVALAIAASTLLDRDVRQQGDIRVSEAARRAEIEVNDAIQNRTRDARVLSASPEVIAAAKEGGARARSLGIVGADIAVLEKRFDVDRSMQVAPGTRTYLRALLPQLEVAEMLLTDSNGYNAVITERSSDFVQSDEAWWQIAWRNGAAPADAAFDSSAHQVAVSVASVVMDGAERVGVIKLAYSATPIVRSLISAGGGVRIDVIDSTDHVVLSTDSIFVGRRVAGVPADSGAVPVTLASDSLSERAVAIPVNSGRWRVLAHLSTSEIDAPFAWLRSALLVATGVLLLALLALLLAVNRFFERRITIPAGALSEVAEAVAAGDFSMDVEHVTDDDEIGRLSRAVGAMITELRRLAETIASSASETTMMTAEITAGTEEMAASAGEIAHTASDLSVQATSMAENIATLAGSSGALKSLAVTLDSGAKEGVNRNQALRSLALENRAELDERAESLGQLADDVNASATAITDLGSASEEIREFVTLVRKLARQSKLLALNAAMEAARAGEHGKGFGVVASEVRRLATMSSDAAEQTEKIVRRVLAGIDSSRTSSERAVLAAAQVRGSTTKASASFAQIERAVDDAERWTTSIERASASTTSLVAEINQRLDALAGGTEAFAAAMEQVAASSEQQSASTQEIAGAANTLGTAAERLSKLVGGLKTV